MWGDLVFRSHHYTAHVCSRLVPLMALPAMMQRDIDTLRTQVSMDPQDCAPPAFDGIACLWLPYCERVELPPDTSIGGAAQLGVTTQAGLPRTSCLAESAGGHPTYLGTTQTSYLVSLCIGSQYLRERCT